MKNKIKKMCAITALLLCMFMVACSWDEGADTYELTESDLEKVYEAGYTHGYSDCSYDNVQAPVDPKEVETPEKMLIPFEELKSSEYEEENNE